MILNSPISRLQEKPFPHSVIRTALTVDASNNLLHWLENDAPWELRIAEFYEQHEFSFNSAVLPAEISAIFESRELDSLRAHVEEIFDVNLDKRIDITAHRLTKGQRIRIHNDHIPGQETHRLLIQLNRGWVDANGGALILFNSRDPSDVHKILRPAHNSGILFQISPNSLHAVTPIHDGQRYTLVLSFFHSAS